MNPDFVDLLRAFVEADVRFLVVGAYALALRRHDMKRVASTRSARGDRRES
jgi:hypothetical protein